MFNKLKILIENVFGINLAIMFILHSRKSTVPLCTSSSVWRKDLCLQRWRWEAPSLTLSGSHFVMSRHCTKLRDKHLLWTNEAAAWVLTELISIWNWSDTDFLWPSYWTWGLLPHPAESLCFFPHHLSHMMHNLINKKQQTHTNRRLWLQVRHIGHINVLCFWRRHKCVRQAAGCLC